MNIIVASELSDQRTWSKDFIFIVIEDYKGMFPKLLKWKCVKNLQVLVCSGNANRLHNYQGVDMPLCLQHTPNKVMVMIRNAYGIVECL